MNFFSALGGFLVKVYRDKRIPLKDKRIILLLCFLIISPLDLMPDWVPFTGLLDDLFYFSTLMNYFFEVLDSDVVLSHFPWSMKSFAKIRALAKFVGALTPKFLRKKLWTYIGAPY